MISAAVTYAGRSLRRHTRRTVLSVAGIAIGCTLALVMESINRGRDELFARMGAYAGAGHLRVVPERWDDRRDPRLRLADWRKDLEAAQSLEGVTAVTVRARTQALLALGTHVVPVELTGVDPINEPRTYRFVQQIRRGRYLTPDDRGAAVVGQAIADRLGAGVDDEILATAVGRDGRIESMMLRIAGIASSGNEEIDASICQVVLADVETLTGLEGAGEVTLILDDWRRTDRVRAALAPRVANGDRVLTWGEISPDFKGHLEQDKAASRLVSAIVLFIVLLGVASAQLAAVLERRREFAVLSALGMHARTIVALLLVEAIGIGLAGAAAGLAVGLPITWRISHTGIDLSRFMGSGFSFQGVILEPIIYGDLGWWSAWYVFAVAIGATVLASLYPAWFAARTNPSDALRVA